MPSRYKTIAFALAFALSLLSMRAGLLAEDPVAVSASDQMKFDTTDMTGKVGQRLAIKLSNDGSMPKAAMAHNLVVLKPGTDVPAFVAAASQRAADDYLPGDEQASHMVAHTRLLGPGEEDTISFTPTAPGVYEYVCTFPGHLAAGMRGQITVQ